MAEWPYHHPTSVGGNGEKSSFLKIPVYLSRNATLMVKVQDNVNEYEHNLQGGTPPNHLPAQSRKYKRKNANLNNRGWS